MRYLEKKVLHVKIYVKNPLISIIDLFIYENQKNSEAKL